MSQKLKNIGIVSFLTVVSRVLGVLRDRMGLGIFGAAMVMDAFVTAFRLPNLFRRLLGEGALTAAFVPALQEELKENGRAGAFRLVSQVASWLLVVAGGCVVVGMLFFGQSRRIAHQDAKWYLAADLTVWVFPYLLLVCLAAIFSAALNVFERFAEPALSPIWLNLTWIAALVAAKWSGASELAQIHLLCAGVLLGGFLQLAVPAAVLWRDGWRPRFELSRAPRVRMIAGWMAPGLFGTAIYQLNVYISGLFAFWVNESAATMLYYANRLMELPIGVFAVAVSTVIYPLISRHAVEKNFVALADDYRKGIRLILMINVPAAAGLAVLSLPIIRVLFESGRFTAADSAAMAPLLALFVIGLPFFSVVSLTTRAFYALKDAATPVRMATVSFLVNLGLSLVLVKRLGAPGLVLASTSAVIVQTLLLQRALAQRLPGMAFRELWVSLGKVLAASAVMTLVVGGGWLLLRHASSGTKLASVAAVCALIPLGAAVYAGMLWALKIEGREEVAALLGKVRAKFGAARA